MYTKISSKTISAIVSRPVILTGERVTLRPIHIDWDAPYLFERSNGSAITLNEGSCEPYDAESRIWQYLFDTKPESVDDMKRLLKKRKETPSALCFCILDTPSQTPIGVCNYMNDYPEHQKVELGGIWYSPIAQGTGANTEAIGLLLTHAFSQGYNRIEWKCDAKNLKSRHVAEKLGFKFEGIQDDHMIVKGKFRDTAWFRILKKEWESKTTLL